MLLRTSFYVSILDATKRDAFSFIYKTEMSSNYLLVLAHCKKETCIEHSRVCIRVGKCIRHAGFGFRGRGQSCFLVINIGRTIC